jgi:uncharacterized protein
MKTSKQSVDDFLAQKKLALVGLSRKGGKFGNLILKNLTGKGYKVYPIHPEAESIDGHPCWKRLDMLPEKVGGAVLVVPPQETEKVVRQAAEAQIGRIWMQQGAESESAIRFCEESGISVVHGHCILMFAEPAGFLHGFHRSILKLFGRLPN